MTRYLCVVDKWHIFRVRVSCEFFIMSRSSSFDISPCCVIARYLLFFFFHSSLFWLLWSTIDVNRFGFVKVQVGPTIILKSIFENLRALNRLFTDYRSYYYYYFFFLMGKIFRPDTGGEWPTRKNVFERQTWIQNNWPNLIDIFTVALNLSLSLSLFSQFRPDCFVAVEA